MRTRWRRWLGNKTRIHEPHWTTLLNSNWLSWASQVYDDCGFEFPRINPMTGSREIVKAVYAKAIDNATMIHLSRLDGLYAADRWM